MDDSGRVEEVGRRVRNPRVTRAALYVEKRPARGGEVRPSRDVLRAALRPAPTGDVETREVDDD